MLRRRGPRWAFLALVLSLVSFVALAESQEEEEEMRILRRPTSVAIAATLLGAISFQMSIFYLTNHPDPDMKRYTYEVISSTISIFCAVLFFQGCNDLVESLVGMEELPLWQQFAIDCLHMVFWYTMLQIVLALISGAIAELIGKPASDMETIDANMKCFAVLLAHVTGFASINAWGTLQQMEPFRLHWLTSLGVLPFAMAVQFGLQRTTDTIRWKVAMADDGVEDEYEKKWDEECEEAEDDVMALTLSFLIVQCIRFVIAGSLPNQEGVEKANDLQHYSRSQISSLFLVALGFALLVVVLYLGMPPNDEARELLMRWLKTSITVVSMSFAWCAFFGLRWFFAGYKLIGANPMLLAIVVALMNSFGSFSIIRALDKIADMEATGEKVDHAIEQVIGAIGILVGFGWEQCFDKATESFSTVLPYSTYSKMVLVLLCCAIIVPAWRWWLLPMALHEGWRFGFVIDPDQAMWTELLEHEKFQKALERNKTRRRLSNLVEGDIEAAAGMEAVEGPPPSDAGSGQPSPPLPRPNHHDSSEVPYRQLSGGPPGRAVTRSDLKVALSQAQALRGHVNSIKKSMSRMEAAIGAGRSAPDS